MTRIISEQTRSICEVYRKAQAGHENLSDTVGYLAAAYDVQRPAIWKALRSGGVLPPYLPKISGGSGRPVGGGIAGYTENRRARMTHSAIDDENMNRPRVERDPCPRCGVRRDFGRDHEQTRLGMML